MNLVQQAFAALRARPVRPTKGEATRAAIVEAALELASRDGLEGLTIGLLAERLGMSEGAVRAALHRGLKAIARRTRRN